MPLYEEATVIGLAEGRTKGVAPYGSIYHDNGSSHFCIMQSIAL